MAVLLAKMATITVPQTGCRNIELTDEHARKKGRRHVAQIEPLRR
jgi:hypothetical protein